MERKEENLWWRLADSALAAGLPLIGLDTAAKILAATYVYGGGNEGLVFSDHYRADVHYIAKRYGVEGGGTPDPDLVEAVKEYRAAMVEDEPPEWVMTLFLERYGVKLNRHC